MENKLLVVSIWLQKRNKKTKITKMWILLFNIPKKTSTKQSFLGPIRNCKNEITHNANPIKNFIQ
uniref:Uncharacterized protein n=1 Tax=Populus trichocarpa TaxID=3694 RepID=A0A2K2AUD4_POPTR